MQLCIINMAIYWHFFILKKYYLFHALKKVIKTSVETLSICVSQCAICIYMMYPLVRLHGSPFQNCWHKWCLGSDVALPHVWFLHSGKHLPSKSVSLPHTTRIPDYTSVKTFNLKEWYLVKQRPKSDLYTMPFWNRYYFMTRSAHIIRWWNAG